MILKQLRLSKHLTQAQLAMMSGLNIRTIQRIEQGHKPSMESLKCLAAALETDINTLQKESFMPNQDASIRPLPLWLKVWFFLGTFKSQPDRRLLTRLEFILHAFGLSFCLIGLFSEAALVGGLLLLVNAYFIRYSKYLGDKFSIWSGS
ncbi:helix-turn-helix transcriptional regulator [Pseudoalteromonas sp. R3]|uniref:helix-turn-helix domain-containing protein n=1 Tax=Pseudoalteromonas sp. R3 TaxID=1709477 RepID=UPI0006B4E50C|nr:helix-turn-helix transcriptional regulator [Pseudoalteromonas sp. R3]AZZ96404.1 XRE family transcriptional regulator [Pseudoalteromonas sp. R3]